jgi:hypothetical protein
VTTCLGIIDEGFLKPWYAKMTAEECAAIIAKAQAGELKQDVAESMILDWPSRMTAAIRYRDHKAAIGSLVHHAIYEWSLGVRITDMLGYLEGEAQKLGFVHEERDGSGESYARTLAREARHYVAGAFEWFESASPTFEAVGHEAVIVSMEHLYAGTTDAIVNVGGAKIHLDFKTSKSVYEKKWRMQIEAYRRADFIGLVTDGTEHEIPPTDRVGVLWIKPMGPSELLTWEPSDDLYEGFLSARHIYGVLNEMPSANPRKKAASKPAKGVCPF